MPASIAAQGVDNANTLVAASPIFTLTIEIPEGLTGAFLFVQVGFDNNINDASVPALAATLDGDAMTCSTAMMSSVDHEQAQMVAYLPIGDGSGFDGEFALDFTSVVPIAPNAMRVAASYQIVDGLEQDPVLSSIIDIVLEDAFGQTLDVPLTVPDDTFVITMCMNGMPTVPSITAPLTYTMADESLNGGTFAFKGQTGWLLEATGLQALAWNTFGSTGLGGARAMSLAFAITPDVPPVEPQYNCECEDAEGSRPLGALRLEVLRATGYAAQANSPPPGIRDMYNDFLNRAQQFIYTRYKSMQTERFFKWTLVPGQRFYGVLDNEEDCPVQLDRYKVNGVWIQDLSNYWWPLRCGINPSVYTMENYEGWPTLYEIRQCIEIFPAPTDAYTLWIKGHFPPTRMVNDTDVTSIEAEPVVLHAIGLAKRHKGMPDAADYFKMADQHVKQMTAGRHLTRRYIPGEVLLPTVAPPVRVP